MGQLLSIPIVKALGTNLLLVLVLIYLSKEKLCLVENLTDTNTEIRLAEEGLLKEVGAGYIFL